MCGITRPIRAMQKFSFQFTLKRLLMLVAIIAAGLGWIAAERAKTRRQQASLAFLESRGAFILENDRRQSWLWKLLVGNRVADRADHVSFEDATAEDLRELVNLRNVKFVSLDHWGDDADLALLANSRALLGLNFIASGLGDNGLLQISKIRQLKELHVDGTPITDAGLAHVSGLRLKSLSLSSTAVSDDGLSSLQDMRSLETLNLGDTRVTDAGLAKLHGLTSLKNLNLLDTKVTNSGVNALRNALPGLEIEHESTPLKKSRPWPGF